MADLSDLLGDVYGETAAAPAPTPAAARPPSWADESLLDQAFADWEPQSSFPIDDGDDETVDDDPEASHAPSAVYDLLDEDEADSVVVTGPVENEDTGATALPPGIDLIPAPGARTPLDDDLAAALSAALAEAPRLDAPRPAADVPAAPAPTRAVEPMPVPDLLVPPVGDATGETAVRRVLHPQVLLDPEPEFVPEPEPHAWVRSDDDILPRRARGARLNLRIR